MSSGPDSTLRDVLMQLSRTHQVQLHPAAAKAFIAHAKQSSINIDEQVDVLRSLLHAAPINAQRAVDAKGAADAIAAHGATGAPDDAVRGRQTRAVPASAVPHVLIDPLRLTVEASVKSTATRMVKADVLRHRHLLALARCTRDEAAAANSAATSANPESAGVRLPTMRIRSLEGQRIGSIVRVLGVLRRAPPAAPSNDAPEPSDGSVLEAALEDTDKVVTVQLSDTHPQHASTLGYFCPGHVVVATGRWTGAAVTEAALSFPPCESRARSLALLGEGADYFGGRIKGELAPRESAIVTVISHCSLDKPSCMASLQRLFATCEEQKDFIDVAATTFVLVGNFSTDTSSKAPMLSDVSLIDDGANCWKRLLGLFDQLGAVIASAAPTVAQQAQFVLVPGPDDVCSSAGGFPQGPLASATTVGLQRRLARVTLASNPCRLRVGTYEMVIMRADVQRHLARQAIVTGSAASSVAPFEHVVHTLAESGTLWPAEGVMNWKDDRLLGIYPLPHAVCVCDSSAQWDAVHRGTHFFNPGSFEATKTFAWITPSAGSVEFNKVES